MFMIFWNWSASCKKVETHLEDEKKSTYGKKIATATARLQLIASCNFIQLMNSELFFTLLSLLHSLLVTAISYLKIFLTKLLPVTILQSKNLIVNMDSKAKTNKNKYNGVIVTNSIKDNGRKKLLVIGKTGAGKSSLCNVFTGHPHDADIFPVSVDAESCTQSTKFAEAFFNGDKEKPISLIDTIGFDDPNNDTDANIISELVIRLRDGCDHINLFGIVVSGQNPRLDSTLIGMLRIFEGMFGEEFWNQVVLVITRLPMDEKSVRRRTRGGKTDEEIGKI